MASWAPRIEKDQARIDWSRRALEVHNRIRAFNPWPLAFTYYGQEKLQLLQTMPSSGNQASAQVPGTLLGTTRDSMLIACGSGSVLEVRELKPASRSAMSGREYANGARLRAGMPIFQELIPQPERIP